jgi:hypothetical protein
MKPGCANVTYYTANDIARKDRADNQYTQIHIYFQNVFVSTKKWAACSPVDTYPMCAGCPYFFPRWYTANLGLILKQVFFYQSSDRPPNSA